MAIYHNTSSSIQLPSLYSACTRRAWERGCAARGIKFLSSNSQLRNKNVYIYYTIFTLVNFLACMHAAIMGCPMHDKKMIILLLEGSCQCQVHLFHALTNLLVMGVQNNNKTTHYVHSTTFSNAFCKL